MQGSNKPSGDVESVPCKANGKEKEYIGIKKYAGLLLTFSSSFFSSTVLLFVKILTASYGYNAYGISFWKSLGTLVPTTLILFSYEFGLCSRKNISVFENVLPFWKNENWKTWIGLLSRGVFGATSAILRYYAVEYLTLADTCVIAYSTPVLVMILAHFFLGEKCGIFPVFIAIVTLGGVVILTKPPLLTGASEFDTNTLIGTAMASSSMACSAFMFIIMRKIRTVHFTVTTLVIAIVGVCEALVLIYFLGHFNMPSELNDSLLVTGVSGFSFLGIIGMVVALKFEQAGPVALVRTCDVLFGFIFQFLFLNVVPDIFSVVGAIIVLGGVLSTGFRKWLKNLPPEDKRRQAWWFILK